MWTLRELLKYSNSSSAQIDGEWVPARPINWKHRSWGERFREAWGVFAGRLDCFKWPKGQ